MMTDEIIPTRLRWADELTMGRRARRRPRHSQALPAPPRRRNHSHLGARRRRGPVSVTAGNPDAQRLVFASCRTRVKYWSTILRQRSRATSSIPDNSRALNHSHSVTNAALSHGSGMGRIEATAIETTFPMRMKRVGSWRVPFKCRRTPEDAARHRTKKTPQPPADSELSEWPHEPRRSRDDDPTIAALAAKYERGYKRPRRDQTSTE